ncbi:hypothetical protein BJ322DRAFT_1019212 [Thelephora terrestris]|uniref:Uncharacterized protein n=1 Tax=Thelephora terrestris TaxID=56493 RepID=A0A9P6HJV4_9AGAM|nr:hypothetical protein BJ322DRAFT_1019212 [Thelephora terrestris]
MEMNEVYVETQRHGYFGATSTRWLPLCARNSCFTSTRILQRKAQGRGYERLGPQRPFSISCSALFEESGGAELGTARGLTLGHVWKSSSFDDLRTSSLTMTIRPSTSGELVAVASRRVVSHWSGMRFKVCPSAEGHSTRFAFGGLSDKIGVRDFLGIPKVHRRERSIARSEIGPNEGTGQVGQAFEAEFQPTLVEQTISCSHPVRRVQSKEIRFTSAANPPRFAVKHSRNSHRQKEKHEVVCVHELPPTSSNHRHVSRALTQHIESTNFQKHFLTPKRFRGVTDHRNDLAHRFQQDWSVLATHSTGRHRNPRRNGGLTHTGVSHTNPDQTDSDSPNFDSVVDGCVV